MSVRDLVLAFTGAGTEELQVRGAFVRVLEAPTAEIYLTVDGQGGSSGELKRIAGQEVHFESGFQRIIVRSAVAQTVRLVVSNTPQRDTSQQVSVSGTFTEAPSTAVAKQPVVSVGAGAGATLIAGSATRDCVRVGIASDQPGGVWIGELGVAADEGAWLEPGQVDYMPTRAALYAWNPGALAVVVNVLELDTP